MLVVVYCLYKSKDDEDISSVRSVRIKEKTSKATSGQKLPKWLKLGQK